jgi:hypothetical protein
MKWTVYQITTPTNEVYIGVTRRSLNTRLAELRCHRGIDGKIKSLAEFEARDDALARENKLVPAVNQGLNRNRGGRNHGVPRYGAENGSALRVSVAGVEYPTARAAADAHGLTKTAANYRFASLYFTDWVYIDAPRAAYWQRKQARQKRKPAISAALQRGGDNR